MHLVIGNKNYSSWSLRPWLLLKHFGIPFTEEVIPLFTPDTKPKLAAISDAAKVPILIDGETTVWDSLAISEFINERYLEGAGWPINAQQRALARCCAAEMHSSFSALRNEMPMNCRGQNISIEQNSELSQDIRRIEEIWTTYRGQHASKEWLFGDFTIADCMFAPVAFRFSTYSIALNDVSKAYMTSLLNHPNMREWLLAANQEPWTIQQAELGL